MNYRLDCKRVYDDANASDGARVLVDRLWPRGKRKEDLALTEWCKDAAPSAALRRAWHAGEVDRSTFVRRYRAELRDNPDALLPLMRHARQGPVTLLTATKDPEQSHVPVLRDAVLAALEREDWEAEGREPSSPTCYGH